MSFEAGQLIDAPCAVCGHRVHGELVVWASLQEADETFQRVVKASTAKAGGYVCGRCGTVLCGKTHKKEVPNAGTLRGYRESPCPTCGTPLLDGYAIAYVEEVEAKHLSPGAPSEPEGGAPPDDEPGPLDLKEVQWGPKAPVQGGTVPLECPGCGAHHQFRASAFPQTDENRLDGVRATDLAYGMAIFGRLIAAAGGVGVFIWVHRALFGSVLEPGPQLLVPAFAAVVGYNILLALFGGISLISSRLKVYVYTCPGCGAEMPFATDGASLVLPGPREGEPT